MALSRKRPKGVRYYAPFGLSVLVIGLMPRSIGYQDLVALMARQSEVPQRARAHMMASPFGTIHAATFSFPQPIGSLIPEPPIYQLASIGPYRSRYHRRAGAAILRAQRRRCRGSELDFPAINRRLKGDLLVTRPHDNEPAARWHPRPDAGAREDRFVPQTRRCGNRRSAARSRAPSRRSARLRRIPWSPTQPKAQSKPDVSSPSYAVASLGWPQREKAAEPTLMPSSSGESNAAVQAWAALFRQHHRRRRSAPSSRGPRTRRC